LEDEVEHLVKLALLSETLNSGVLVVPQIHHNALDDHVLEVFGADSLGKLIEVELVDGMDLRVQTFDILDNGHNQSHSSHRLDLVI
jgi:hypothetical protein